MIYKDTEEFPDKERYSLTDQIRRAAVSVTSNIAEGFSRRSSKEKSRFYDMAQASLVELQNQLIVSKDVGYLVDKKFDLLAKQTVAVKKLLSGLLRAASRKKFES